MSAKNLFNSLVSLQTKLSEIYMCLATLSEETHFSRVYDKAYYDAIEHKHFFIDLRKLVKEENAVFSESLIEEAAFLDRQLNCLLQNSKKLDKAQSYHGLSDLMCEVETRVIKLFGLLADYNWEEEAQELALLISRKEIRLSEMQTFRQVKSSEKTLAG